MEMTLPRTYPIQITIEQNPNISEIDTEMHDKYK